MNQQQKPVLEFIHQSNLIEGYDSSEVDKMSLGAWEWLVLQDELSHGVICKTQKTITTFQDDLRPHERGYYRSMAKVNVYVGNHYAPMWHMVDSLMSNWLLDYKGLGWKAAHIRFEQIHPFADGNGRTGRMLMNWQRLKEGLPLLTIWNKDKADYYKWFKEKK